MECLVPDMNGIPRGKILPATKFMKGVRDDGLQPAQLGVPADRHRRLPGHRRGRYRLLPGSRRLSAARSDTIRFVPWYADPTAQVIHDCYDVNDKPVEHASRYVLKRVLELYDDKGWKPIVAPELEFYLVQVNTDPDLPLLPPIGKSGRAETGSQAYGIDAVNDFDHIFEDVYDYCERSEIDVDTLVHESGSAQMEINFNHGNPLELADQAFLFKRTVRQAAMKHGIYATFMSKPLANQPGSSMHLHQSVVEKRTGKTLFADSQGSRSGDVPRPCRGPAEISAAADPDAGAERQLLSPPASAIRCADQCAMGCRQSVLRSARAGLQRSGTSHRESPGRCGCQPVSSPWRPRWLRLSRDDRAPEADQPDHRQRLSHGPHPAEDGPGSLAALHGLQADPAAAGRQVHQGACGS